MHESGTLPLAQEGALLAERATEGPRAPRKPDPWAVCLCEGQRGAAQLYRLAEGSWSSSPRECFI